MTHWITGMDRGLYHMPQARPPTPQPHNGNDLASRIARIEEHVTFAAHDRQRIETEGWQRAVDNAHATKALSQRVASLERSRERALGRKRLWRKGLTWVVPSLKFAMAALLFAMWAAGKLTVEELKALSGALR